MHGGAHAWLNSTKKARDTIKWVAIGTGITGSDKEPEAADVAPPHGEPERTAESGVVERTIVGQLEWMRTTIGQARREKKSEESAVERKWFGDKKPQRADWHKERKRNRGKKADHAKNSRVPWRRESYGRGPQLLYCNVICSTSNDSTGTASGFFDTSSRTGGSRIESLIDLLDEVRSSMEILAHTRGVFRLVHLNCNEWTLLSIKTRLDEEYRGLLVASALQVEAQQAELVKQ
ncbi:hypothetical protein K438DRAFT_1781692 [Mycena galopus ATCC 62051]|nr:hypothetical protein K438DRAFT_1781692 [Mycena galopus ATCC 62051]